MKKRRIQLSYKLNIIYRICKMEEVGVHVSGNKRPKLLS